MLCLSDNIIFLIAHGTPCRGEWGSTLLWFSWTHFQVYFCILSGIFQNQ